MTTATRLNQKGSLHIVLLVGVLVLAVVGFAGYRVYTNQNSSGTAAPVAQTATVPAAIHTKADLTQTSKALDDDSAQLDSSLNDDSLDGDINSML